MHKHKLNKTGLNDPMVENKNWTIIRNFRYSVYSPTTLHKYLTIVNVYLCIFFLFCKLFVKIIEFELYLWLLLLEIDILLIWWKPQISPYFGMVVVHENTRNVKPFEQYINLPK